MARWKVRLTPTIAFKISQIREDLFIPGSPDHDWDLAETFLDQCYGNLSDDDLYSWFIQLEENIVKY